MDLTQFIDFDPSAASAFFDLNALAHETIFTALLASGVVLEHYPMWTDRVSPDWLEIHYREHQAWSSALNLAAPPDLGMVDFETDASRQAWLQNHYLHHARVAQALSL